MSSLEYSLKSEFPSLRANNHKITSPTTEEYNCIAWAAGENERWWWPSTSPFTYWPVGFPLTSTVENFIATFGSLGYKVCENETLEPTYEKVALYANESGMPTYMARQVENGSWTSKLGSNHDIEHFTLDVISGHTYGVVVKILRRARQ